MGDERDELDIAAHTRRRRSDGTTGRHSNEINVPSDRSKGVTVRGKRSRPETIDTSDRKVQHFLNQMDDAIARDAYWQTPPNTVAKPIRPDEETPVEDENGEIPCPKCRGEWDGCAFCRGHGRVASWRAKG